MKNTLTRVLLILLSLVMCFGLFACADPDDKDDNTDEPAVDDPAQNEPEKVEEILPDIEPQNFDYTVNVMHWKVGEDPKSWCPWNEICPDDGVTGQIGDIVADDIFDRTGWLKENYGISLTNTFVDHPKIAQTVTTLLSSGSNEYQVFVDFSYNAQSVMGRNYFLDLAVLPNVDFEKPWWVTESIEELAIGDFVEMAASDLLVLDKGATSMIFYNIPMADALSLDNLYDLVDNGEWTIATMAEYAEMAYADDGNDQRDQYDTFGFANGDDLVLDLYAAAGMKLISRNADDEYYYSYGNDEETVEVMTSILEDVMYQDFFWNSWLTRNEVSDQPSFKKDQSLFSQGMAKSCNSFRDMESAYGILPVPKYDEEQEQYYSRVNNYHDSLIAVFNTVDNPEAIGAALEVMGYYSYYNIYSDFYEVVIQGRGTRDEESRRMLDLIFSNRTYDLGLVYDPNGFSDKVLRFTHTGGTDIASFMGEWRERLNTSMDDLNELASTYW